MDEITKLIIINLMNGNSQQITNPSKILFNESETILTVISKDGRNVYGFPVCNISSMVREIVKV